MFSMIKTQRVQTPQGYLKEACVLSVYAFLVSAITLGLGVGSALAALYKNLFRLMNQKDTALSRRAQFISDTATKKFQKITVTLILAGFAALATMILSVDNAQLAYTVFGVFLAFETLLMAAYIFPAYATFNFPNALYAFKTAFLMGHLHAFTTLKVMLTFVLLSVPVLMVSPFIAPLAFIVYAYGSSKTLHPVFMHYVRVIEAKQTQASEENDGASDLQDSEENPQA